MPTWVPDWSVANIADPLWSPLADAQSVAIAKYLGNGVLSVTGILSATLATAEEITFVDSSNPELIAGICRPSPDDVTSASYVGGGSLLDAYCRTICCDNCGDGYLPTLPHFPDLPQSRNALIAFLKNDEAQMPDCSPGTDAAKFLDWAWNFCPGRSFFTTKEGYIGLAPKAAKPNDQVCVIFGCPSSMLLRPRGNVRFQVVGECYVAGLTKGEAILGQVPDEYKPVLAFDDVSKDHYASFVKIDTGEEQKEDPRLRSLLKKGIEIFEQDKNPTQAARRLNLEALKASGVQIATLELE
jgi:hypothetical protein